jgi:hypothetical protein
MLRSNTNPTPLKQLLALVTEAVSSFNALHPGDETKEKIWELYTMSVESEYYTNLDGVQRADLVDLVRDMTKIIDHFNQIEPLLAMIEQPPCDDELLAESY